MRLHFQQTAFSIALRSGRLDRVCAHDVALAASRFELRQLRVESLPAGDVIGASCFDVISGLRDSLDERGCLGGETAVPVAQTG